MDDNTQRTIVPDVTNGAPTPDATIRVTVPGGQDAASDATIRVDAPKTVVPDGGSKTIRPEIIQDAAPEPPQGDVFMLKGEIYQMVRCLSDNSGEAQVYLVRYNGKEYVLKVYYPNFDINKRLMLVVLNFQFEMIVHVYDFGKTYVDGKHRYYELMEYLHGGSLQDYVLGKDINKFRRIALQAASALAYCHKNNVLHKDIKPSNYFFRDEEHTQLVLGDFGISSLLENDGKSYRTTQARTPIYAAPEMYSDVIDGEVEITPAADFYSLGITLFTLWLGENPMSANERMMMKQKNEGRLPRLGELPERVKMIVQGLTAVNPASRWKYEEVERWFLGEDVPVDITSPFLRYKSFIVDPDKNLVAENVHELVPMLIENERLAMNYLYGGRITQWLESSGNTKLSTVVKDIITNRYPADQKAGLMATVYAMEPTYPYHDIQNEICDDTHSIALSLLSNQEKYALQLQNPNDSLFLWLESHYNFDVNRLRTYFKPGVDSRIAILKLVYEIDKDIPYLTNNRASNIHEIIHTFGHTNPSEDDWHSLVDGRLLSWMYSHEDAMACESLRILINDQPYSDSLAYKVLYNMDRSAAYDLRDASSQYEVGCYLSEKLIQLQHCSDEELVEEAKDFTDPNGRFNYYAQLHGWHQEIAEAARCFDLESEENTERMSLYDLRTALYRFCRILGYVPHYALSDGTVLEGSEGIDHEKQPLIRQEIRRGAFMQWLSVSYHEDPSRNFAEEFSYERELESWLLAIGSYDNQQPNYKRFMRAREETTDRINAARSLWNLSQLKKKIVRISFYSLSAIWCLLILILGISNHDQVLHHSLQYILLPVGGMTGIIVGVRTYFKGVGPLASLAVGIVGLFSAYIPIYILKMVNDMAPSLFEVVCVAMMLVYVLIAYLTDYHQDEKNSLGSAKDIIFADDVNTTLIEPLFYTFKTKAYRFKSTKFPLLNDVMENVRGSSGEVFLHYVLWTFFALILVVEFCMFSPKLLNLKKPDAGLIDVKKVIEQFDEEHENIINEENTDNNEDRRMNYVDKFKSEFVNQ